NFGALAVAEFADNKDVGVFFHNVHANHVVACTQPDAAHTAADPAHWAGIGFMEANCLPLGSADNHFFVAVGHANPFEFIAFIQVDGNQAALADILVLLKRSLFDNTSGGAH